MAAPRVDPAASAVFAERQIATSFGPVRLTATQAGLAGVGLVGERPERYDAWVASRFAEAERVADVPLLDEAEGQLRAYFDGARTSFDLPLDTPGTPFQERVWRALRDIPFGKTASYLDIARALGCVTAVRAVGAANGKNPVAIVVPCHRVVGADGSLVGYGGGMAMKARLLAHERARAGQTRLPV